ncbi:MAG TPA: prevent-host-death protein [Arachnia sp.]|nr:prevent-host-death protein [Arachnia sp.]HMT87597.1 prevent-host-death protein [Arachnia sp.]
MGEQISQRELRNESGRIMRGLDEGRSYVITRRSEPVGELIPLRRRRFVDTGTVLSIFANAPKVDAELFFADLDAAVDQDPTPRG